MTELILFHHSQGLTEGVRAFADELRAAGHVVHVPDLYEGRTFAALADGIGHAGQVGFDTIIERGRLAAGGLPEEVVYAGFSLGRRRRSCWPRRVRAPGRTAAALLVDPTEFGGPWPDGLPLQLHMMDGDEQGLPPNEDLEVARRLAGTVESAELFVYPGDRHLFADPSLPDYDERAATLVRERVLAFLDGIGSRRDGAPARGPPLRSRPVPARPAP